LQGYVAGGLFESSPAPEMPQQPHRSPPLVQVFRLYRLDEGLDGLVQM
jgi:hypothetical protein